MSSTEHKTEAQENILKDIDYNAFPDEEKSSFLAEFLQRNPAVASLCDCFCRTDEEVQRKAILREARGFGLGLLVQDTRATDLELFPTTDLSTI